MVGIVDQLRIVWTHRRDDEPRRQRGQLLILDRGLHCLELGLGLVPAFVLIPRISRASRAAPRATRPSRMGRPSAEERRVTRAAGRSRISRDSGGPEVPVVEGGEDGGDFFHRSEGVTGLGGRRERNDDPHSEIRGSGPHDGVRVRRAGRRPRGYWLCPGVGRAARRARSRSGVDRCGSWRSMVGGRPRRLLDGGRLCAVRSGGHEEPELCL